MHNNQETSADGLLFIFLCTNAYASIYTVATAFCVAAGILSKDEKKHSKPIKALTTSDTRSSTMILSKPANETRSSLSTRPNTILRMFGYFIRPAAEAVEKAEISTLLKEMHDYGEEIGEVDSDMQLIIELNARSDEEQEAIARELRAAISRLQSRLGCSIAEPRVEKKSGDKEYSLEHRQHLREAIRDLIERKNQYILAPVPPIKELTSKKIAEIRENIKQIQLARREIHQQIVTLESELLECSFVEVGECRASLKIR